MNPVLLIVGDGKIQWPNGHSCVLTDCEFNGMLGNRSQGSCCSNGSAFPVGHGGFTVVHNTASGSTSSRPHGKGGGCRSHPSIPLLSGCANNSLCNLILACRGGGEGCVAQDQIVEDAWPRLFDPPFASLFRHSFPRPYLVASSNPLLLLLPLPLPFPLSPHPFLGCTGIDYTLLPYHVYYRHTH